MNMPFTTEQFLEVFRTYNATFRTMPILTYALGIAAIVLLFRPVRHRGRWIALILSFFWVWNGAAYHLGFFRAINNAAVIFGGLFVLQGLLFLVAGVLRDRLHFEATLGPRGAIGSLFVVYAMIIYPVLGSMAGHAYPASPVFGMAPCPTTIFTFGMMLFVRDRVPVFLLVIPLLWSIVGLGAAANLGIYEDFGLTAAGLLGSGILIARSVRSRRLVREGGSR